MAKGWNVLQSVYLACSGTSARVALPDVGDQPRKVRLMNVSADVVFVRFGTSAVEAEVVDSGTPSNDLPLPGNGFVEILEAPESATHVAGITGGNAVDLYVTMGHGD